MGQSSSSPSPGVLYQPSPDLFALVAAIVPSLGLAITSPRSKDGDLSFNVPAEFITQKPRCGDATLKLKLAPGQEMTFEMALRGDIRCLSFITAESFEEIRRLVNTGRDADVSSVFSPPLDDTTPAC
jgi:hypothetical protein